MQNYPITEEKLDFYDIVSIMCSLFKLWLNIQDSEYDQEKPRPLITDQLVAPLRIGGNRKR